MEIVKSELELLNFLILNFEFSFIPPKAEIKKEKLFSDYLIDMDFMIKEVNGNYNVFTKIEINRKKTHAGYSIFIEGVGVYNLKTKKELVVKEISNFLHSSGLQMGISHLRTYISTITASAPMGRYLLPSIDLGKLLLEKTKRLEELKNKKADPKS